MVATAAPEKQLVRAQAKWVRTSARKGRVVAEHIRGRSVPEARAVLAFTQRAAARDIEKVLSSAVANAEANNGLVGDDLFVYTVVRRRRPDAEALEGPRPRPGRADQEAHLPHDRDADAARGAGCRPAEEGRAEEGRRARSSL